MRNLNGLKGTILVSILWALVTPGTNYASWTEFVKRGMWSDSTCWKPSKPQKGDEAFLKERCILDEQPPELKGIAICGDVRGNLDNSAGYDIVADWLDAYGGPFYSGENGNIEIRDLIRACQGGEMTIRGSLFLHDEATLTIECNDGQGGRGHFWKIKGNGRVEVWGEEDESIAHATFEDSIHCARFWVGDWGSAGVYGPLHTHEIRTFGPCGLGIYADVECHHALLEGPSARVIGEHTFTVIDGKLSIQGRSELVFEQQEGELVLLQKDSSLCSISVEGRAQFNDVRTVGKVQFGMPEAHQLLDINGDLLISKGSTFQVFNNTIRLAGDFVCNGLYDIGSYEPTFYFDGTGKTQRLKGNVRFHRLVVDSAAFVDTGNWVAFVKSGCFEEKGYLQGHVATQSYVKAHQPVFADLGFALVSETDLGSTSLVRTTGSAYPLAQASVKRWFRLQAARGTSRGSLSLRYNERELNGNPEENLVLVRFAGGSATVFSPTRRDTIANSVTFEVTIPQGSSDWLLVGQYRSYLSGRAGTSPRVSYDAQSRTVNMVWRIFGTNVSKGIVLQRRLENERKYRTTGVISDIRTDSTGLLIVTCADKIVETTDKYFYRLAEVDSHGSVKPRTKEVAVAPSELSTPTRFSLMQNTPNPFNLETKFTFSLPELTDVSLLIYDLEGRIVKSFDLGRIQPGMHSIVWDSTDERGQIVPSGIYLYVLKAGNFTASRKMMLVK